MKILTFDIEEWFHILDNIETQNEKNWANYESRIEKNMEIIFEIIKNSNVKATFFVVGWLAKKYPEIIKLISHNKFEIGIVLRVDEDSNHCMVYWASWNKPLLMWNGQLRKLEQK